jgi:hypothetical protein
MYGHLLRAPRSSKREIQEDMKVEDSVEPAAEEKKKKKFRLFKRKKKKEEEKAEME